MSTAPTRATVGQQAASGLVDPRGMRFAAGLTAVVLAVALLLAPSPATTGLVAAQAVVFALSVFAGLTRTPYSWVFRTLVRPRLGAPREREDARPPRFAQAVGLVFTLVALTAFLTGLDLLGLVATGAALAAAFLNAAFGLCLGCEVYLLIRRVTTT